MWSGGLSDWMHVVPWLWIGTELELSAKAVERVPRRFDAVARLIEEQRSTL